MLEIQVKDKTMTLRTPKNRHCQRRRERRANEERSNFFVTVRGAGPRDGRTPGIEEVTKSYRCVGASGGAKARRAKAPAQQRLRAVKAPRSVGSAQRGLRRSLRRRGLNGAGPKRSGAETERGRERGSRTDAKADGPPGRLPSPLPSVWAGGRGRFHPSYSAS